MLAPARHPVRESFRALTFGTLNLANHRGQLSTEPIVVADSLMGTALMRFGTRY
jgi:hypothetical protein